MNLWYSLLLCLGLTSLGCAQSKPATAPDQVVKSLYEARKSVKTDPFYQTDKRELLDRYFAPELADLIWKDAQAAKDEPGALDFDPLYASQDPQIEDFRVGKPRLDSGPDHAFVKVTFKDSGRPAWVDYELHREKRKGWKIVGVYYHDGEDLASYLRFAHDEEFRKAHEDNTAFSGEYLAGGEKFTVTPTLNGMHHRVQWEGQDTFQLYVVDGSETETAYIHMDEEGQEKSRFVFQNEAREGKFIPKAGKEVKVRPAE